MKSIALLAGGLGAVMLLILSPALHAVVVGANFLAHLFVLGVQFIAARLPVRRPPQRGLPEGDEPFISIHVPAHNEPPELLIQTLDSLARLKWSNYEVLVMDNNTADESLWRPVEAHCRTLGPRFRFFHVEGLKGFKAGAMNRLLRLMDPRAEFIFVVDADYVVDRRALRRALRYVTDERVALVQFPQNYRNVGPGNLGVALDYQHFFAGYMAAANRLGCVPSTGTLSLIRVRALQEVGGFSEQVVTEDAELGLKLNLHGHRTVYAPENVGEGLMPHALADLKKQRWRWAFGNAQILKANWRRMFFGRELDWRQKLGCLAHLTAWFNFHLIPSLSLLLLAGLAALDRLQPEHVYLVPLAGFTLLTSYLTRFGVLYHSLRPEGYPLREIIHAFAAHAGLSWIFSTSWLKCLWNHRAPFVRTNKFLGRVPGVLAGMFTELGLGVAMLGATVALVAADFVIGPLATLLFCIARFAILGVARQMRWTYRQTVALVTGPEEPAPKPLEEVTASEEPAAA